jgi:hypothetical protein
LNSEQLTVVTARFNPLHWEVPHRHYLRWVEHMKDSGVGELIVVELEYGDREFSCNVPGVTHVGVRADSWGWSKENLGNLGIQRAQGRLICWEDSDIYHRDPNWARETVHALQHYRAVQTWSQCLDMGPNGNVHSVSRSFADCYLHGSPVAADKSPWWKHEGGPYDYAHSGFSWAFQRELLNQAGGLLEIGCMGSGDYHMALGMVGKAEWSLVKETSESYRRQILYWQERARRFVNGRLGVVTGTIEHQFHGSKTRRGYMSRWDMFAKHGFDPDTDLKRNTYGVLEWAGNKPELEREWDLYLRSRREDDNCN